MVQRLPLHDVATMFGHGFHISDFMVFSPPGLRKTSVRNSFLVAFGLMKLKIQGPNGGDFPTCLFQGLCLKSVSDELADP